MIVVHLVVSVWVFPLPVTGDRLREKVIALTRHGRPAVVIAGDSRAAWQVIPSTLASELGQPEGGVINIALEYCESAAVLAACREFGDRFAASPIVLISVSSWTLNDHPSERSHVINDETLWSIGIVDRLRLVSTKRALAATLLPEKALWSRFTSLWRAPVKRVAEWGFMSQADPIDRSSGAIQDRARMFVQNLYSGAKTDGVCWRQLKANLKQLVEAGVQVVVLDSPEHPAFLAAISGTPEGDADERYHRRLAALGERLRIPVLRYEPARFGDTDPNLLYHDLLHLNRSGATILSEWIGQDLRRLIERGILRLPTQRMPRSDIVSRDDA